MVEYLEDYFILTFLLSRYLSKALTNAEISTIQGNIHKICHGKFWDLDAPPPFHAFITVALNPPAPQSVTIDNNFTRFCAI